MAIKPTAAAAGIAAFSLVATFAAHAATPNWVESTVCRGRQCIIKPPPISDATFIQRITCWMSYPSTGRGFVSITAGEWSEEQFWEREYLPPPQTMSIVDGTSNTILIGETRFDVPAQTSPAVRFEMYGNGAVKVRCSFSG